MHHSSLPISAPTDMLAQYTHSGYLKLMVTITPQMSYDQIALPVFSEHRQTPQDTCWNKPSLNHILFTCVSFRKYPQALIFWMYYFSLTNYFLYSPNSQLIHISEIAYGKNMQLVKFAYEFSCLSLSHFPILGVPLKLDVSHRRLPLERTHASCLCVIVSSKKFGL